MDVSTHMCIYVYIHVMCASINVSAHIYVDIYASVPIDVCTHIDSCICVCIP